MAAALRGGSGSAGKPRAKSATKAAKRPDSAKNASPKTAKTASSAGYAPAKLDAAKRVGLPPRIAVGVAGGVAAIGLVAGLAPSNTMKTPTDEPWALGLTT